MFDHLLLHDSARLALLALAQEPPQGLLVVGPSGIGKQTIAVAWASGIVGQATDIRVVEPDDKGTITIETVRELYRAARGKQQGRQVIIIANADAMSLEAENAFLKLLEEPRPGLTFILTAERQEALLPTIRSRVQHITLQPLSDSAVRQFIMAKKPAISQTDLAQLVFLAQGRPGVVTQLLASDRLPEQRQQMQQIKHLLSAKPYERFLLINKLAADRTSCIASLQAMMHMAEIQLRSARTQVATQQWVKLADALQDCLQAVSHNGNLRAQLLLLFSRY